MPVFEDRFYNSVDGIRLHYRDYQGPRDKPPILCLPGLTRNSRDFEPLAEHFAGKWRIIALDFRGRGLSDPDPQPARYVPQSYAADVMKLLDQLGIAEAVFVGTSLGGLVTMLITATGDEERIAGALINDVGPEFDTAGIDRIGSYVGIPQRWASWDEAAQVLADRNRTVFPKWNADAWERFARRLAREDGNGGIVLDYDMAIGEPFKQANGKPQPDLWPLIDGLKGKPVTVLRGALSDLLKAGTAERMIERLGPPAELVTVPDVGHAPTFEEPESIAAIERLLARVEAAVD